ncbi:MULTISPECIES: MFS transporter [unclassified Pseudomonas]|uniref:MFS transporter n=1 Tax=unclassified Pseudomonas TaxID=196821 RepID=UPI00244961EF|nr:MULTISPECIES: MFS transporter [unclassified Pseudomonas]MDH0303307.1 MFS transporter [Pseudomonas sp. GD04091]MDH1985331.1 MFS transporter [Pseudomonas sp. GD03689]
MKGRHRYSLITTLRNIIVLRLLFVMANALGPFAALFFNRHYQLDGSAVALVITLVSAFYLTGNVLGGALASRCAFRPLLLGTSLCSSVFLLLAMMFSTPITSIAMVLMVMLCAGVITPVFSMLTSLAADDGNRIASFGYLHLATNLGAALLFVIGGYLLGLQSHYLMVFAAAVSVACFLASVFLALPERQVDTPQARRGILRDMAGTPRIVLVAGALFFALSVLDAQREYQLPLWLDLIAVERAASIFAAVGIVNALLVILITQPLIALTSRFGTLANLAAAGVFYGIGFGAYAFFEQTALILSFVLFWTMGEILGITHITALISQKTSLQNQASLFSLIPVLLALARMVSVGVGASLISRLGFTSSWSLYGLLGLLLGGICWLLGREATASQASSPRQS